MFVVKYQSFQKLLRKHASTQITNEESRKNIHALVYGNVDLLFVEGAFGVG
jgi:hypothetical protein